MNFQLENNVKIVSHDMNINFWKNQFANERNFSMKSKPKGKAKVLANKSRTFSLLKCGRLFQFCNEKIWVSAESQINVTDFPILVTWVFSNFEIPSIRTKNLHFGSCRVKKGLYFGKSPLNVEGLISYDDSSGNYLLKRMPDHALNLQQIRLFPGLIMARVKQSQKNCSYRILTITILWIRND